MRYYCKNCGSLLISSGIIAIKHGCCPFCEAFGDIIKIPDYETPEQYAKRTGEPWPDNAPVWGDYELFIYREPFREWRIFGYWKYKGIVEAHNSYEAAHRVVCAQSPNPPPDGWEPEEDV